MQKYQLNSLDFVINGLFMKLFKTSNIRIVQLCQQLFHFELPSVLQLARRRKILQISFACKCLLSRRSRQRERLRATGRSICSSVRLSVYLFVCLSPKDKNAIFSKTKQFRAMSLLMTYRKSYVGFTKNPLLDP